MYEFDEKSLIVELGALSKQARIAFAAAAATRQLGNYERLARALGVEHIQRPREIATQLWTDLRSDTVDRTAWSARLDEVMGLLPEESDDWIVSHALADDALSSLAYAIRCLLTPEPREAAWAARRAYEAVDQAAIRVLDVQPGLPNTESAIKSHGFVQRELARQRRDILMLSAGSFADVQWQAFEEEILTDTEAACVSK